MIIQIVGIILGILVSVSLIVVAIVYIFSKVRENDMTVLRNANTDLRSTGEDNAKKITDLSTQVQLLTDRIGILEKHNKTLEDLVVTALKQYFLENPKMAGSIKDIIVPQV